MTDVLHSHPTRTKVEPMEPGDDAPAGTPGTR